MIGVFDSGLGGLTVVKEIFRQLPGYGVVYFGDTARTPYGNKSREVVTRYAIEDAEFLRRHGAQVIVVACNTASALAVDELRRRVKLPIFEVVTPAVAKAAALGSRRVGVIGTRGTIRSGIYSRKMRRVAPGVKVIGQACPLFVPLVEEGWLRRPETLKIAKSYLKKLRWPKVQALVLGCTHYPFLKPLIRRLLGRRVALVDPAKETVTVLKKYLSAHPELDRRLRRNRRCRFFVSDLTGQFRELAAAWLGQKISLKQAKVG